MKRPEERAHRAIVQTLRTLLPSDWLVWHTPNGGGRSKAEAGILKALGTLAGMPDLFVLGPGCKLYGLEVKPPAAELPSGKLSQAKPRVSETQKIMFPKLAALGVPVLIVTDAEEAVMALSSLGVPFRGRVR